MADTTILKGEYRKEFGKGASRRLRRDGRIPGVLYASHQEPVHFHVDRIETQALVRREGVNAVFELELDGEQFLSMVKVIDQNILTLDIDHLDLQAIKRGEKVEVSVPVIAEGEVFSGAMLIQEEETILVEASALSIPEELTVSVAGVEAGNQVLAGDITLPEGVTLVDEADKLVLNIVAEEVAEIPEDGEEAAAEGEAESAE
ncbi:50S ribosomal protein L25/general stress protein Ctc [Corynebacterium guangdongense]|uniref:Large ribosomal subunit protein bL25 n=1 Tax=Corynebacterium guangdongense TaxID=1783348 RepID=A0ABU1ZVD7_9CORY|nr:50S ribosomal protein L25/general stress protein Ctc [Corynebacterium guangdongense]MDR7328892.1 large subunit ribosomal protein L25 [Corynebacterium guangdongense]WJZ17467.1 General stress protein CTC [Corynebacterium guangdongense]